MPDDFPKPPFPEQQQPSLGLSFQLSPQPDYGEDSYVGSQKLLHKKTLITGGDSGIGRAVALAFAREGADVAISYLSEHDDARETKRLVEDCGRECILLPGDLIDPAHCRDVVAKVIEAFGRVDVLVNNAAHQTYHEDIADVTDEDWERTLAVNLSAAFFLSKAAIPHMKPGASIINTASKQADEPSPPLLAYAVTKGAIQNFSAGLGQQLAKRGIRVNTVAPGPVWTPLVASSLPPEQVQNFGKDMPIGRPAQPRELAPAYVLLASDEASYMIASTIAVTGGKPVM